MRYRWFLILVVVAGVAVIIANILRLLTPESQPIPQSPFVVANIDGTQTKFSDIEYVGNEIEIPKTVKVARVESLPTDTVATMTQGLGLAAHPSRANLWSNDTYTLLLIKATNQYNLSLNNPETQENFADPEQAQLTANNFISSYFPHSNLEIITNKIIYSVDDHGHQGEAGQARYIYYPYSYKVDNYPVKMGQVNVVPVAITINSQNQIQKVDFFSQQYKFEVLEIKPTLTVEQAVTNIQAGKASISRAFNTQLQAIDLSQVQSAKLRQAEIEYRVDDSLQLAYPFFHFSGQATDAQGIEIQVDILTPAIPVADQTI